MENYKSQLLKILKNVHYTFVLKTAFGVHMQLKSKYNKGIQLLLWAINIFRKYAWVFSLKDKAGITIIKSF